MGAQASKKQTGQDVDAHKKPWKRHLLIFPARAEKCSVGLKSGEKLIRVSEQLWITNGPVDSHALPAYEKDEIVWTDESIADQADHAPIGWDSRPQDFAASDEFSRPRQGTRPLSFHGSLHTG